MIMSINQTMPTYIEFLKPLITEIEKIDGVIDYTLELPIKNFKTERPIINLIINKKLIIEPLKQLGLELCSVYPIPFLSVQKVEFYLPQHYILPFYD